MGKAKHCRECGTRLKPRDWVYCSDHCYTQARAASDSDDSGVTRNTRPSGQSRRSDRSSGNGSSRRRPHTSRNSYVRDSSYFPDSSRNSQGFFPPPYPPPYMPSSPPQTYHPPPNSYPYYPQNAPPPGFGPGGGGGGPWSPYGQCGHHQACYCQGQQGGNGNDMMIAAMVAGPTLVTAGMQMGAGCCTIM